MISSASPGLQTEPLKQGTFDMFSSDGSQVDANGNNLMKSSLISKQQSYPGTGPRQQMVGPSISNMELFRHLQDPQTQPNARSFQQQNFGLLNQPTYPQGYQQRRSPYPPHPATTSENEYNLLQHLQQQQPSYPSRTIAQQAQPPSRNYRRLKSTGSAAVHQSMSPHVEEQVSPTDDSSFAGPFLPPTSVDSWMADKFQGVSIVDEGNTQSLGLARRSVSLPAYGIERPYLLNEESSSDSEMEASHPNKFAIAIEEHGNRHCCYKRQPTRSGPQVKVVKNNGEIYSPTSPTETSEVSQELIRRYYRKDLVR